MKKSQSKGLILIGLISFVLYAFGCKDSATDGIGNDNQFKLKIIDVSTTEVVISISGPSISGYDSIVLLRNGTSIGTLSSSLADTLVIDTTLQEGASYKYRLGIVSGDDVFLTGNELHVRALTRSSNEFTWTTFTFGGGEFSHLSDVCIAGDSTIWASGEVSVMDSNGALQSPPYNIVQIKGENVQFKSLEFEFSDYVGYSEAASISAFGNHDIVISSPSCVMSYDGRSWKRLGYLYQNGTTFGTAFLIWASSSTSVYAGGTFEQVVHWDGSSWKELVPQTSGIITDCWGTTNPIDGSELAYSAATDFESNTIFQFRNHNKVDTIPWQTTKAIRSFWTQSGVVAYSGGDGVSRFDGRSWTDVAFSGFLFLKIRGQGLNDVFAVSNSGLITHFDGDSWNLVHTENDVVYSSVAVKYGIVAACGRSSDIAVLTIGKRVMQ